MKANYEKGTKICSKCKKELPINQLKKRENSRKRRPYNKHINPHGVLIWYDNKLDKLTINEYKRRMKVKTNE